MDDLFAKLLQAPKEQQLVVMPISRLFVETACRIGDFYIFPPGEIDLGRLRPVPNKNLPKSGNAVYVGQDLRDVQTSATGISCGILAELPLVAFIVEIDWESFLSQNHKEDIQLLQRLSEIAERAFDHIRFHLCRFDKPGFLPGPVGSWSQSSAFLGALLYTLHDNESYLIAGEAIECSVVVKGIGLELSCGLDSFPQPQDGDVASIMTHALSLFRDVLTSNSDTIKFGRAMTLIEFLATPDSYRNWKKLKGDIACHVAHDKSEYLKLCRRFEELTSIKDKNGKQTGLRTLIIHHGQFLEDIFPGKAERESLFRELQRYAECVISDMIENPRMTWAEFQSFRDHKKRTLGVV